MRKQDHFSKKLLPQLVRVRIFDWEENIKF